MIQQLVFVIGSVVWFIGDQQLRRDIQRLNRSAKKSTNDDFADERSMDARDLREFRIFLPILALAAVLLY